MADYVRETILSQAYAHIETVKLSEEEKRKFEIDIAIYQAPRAKKMLGSDIVPEIRTKDGSLIVYSTVYGSLADTLGAPKDFMSAINQLFGASKMLAEACNVESLFLCPDKDAYFVRSEGRTGVVRTTKELFDNIERIILKRGETHTKIETILAAVDKKIIFLNDQLTWGRDKKLVWDNFLPMLKSLQSNIHRIQAAPDPKLLAGYKAAINDMAIRVVGFAGSGDKALAPS